MLQTPPRYVFVYGTLRREGRLDINRLQPAPRFVGMGRIKGSLYPLDGYPGLLLDGEEPGTVVGEVYQIAPALEAVLDGIEQIIPGPASEYFKRERLIELEGHRLACLIYEINPDRVRGKRPLEQGDWIKFHNS